MQAENNPEKRAKHIMIKHTQDVAKEEVKAGDKTTRQVLIGADEAPHFALRRFEIQPGGGMPPHTNTVEHEQYVLSGRARIGIDDDIHEVCAGDVVFIPAGAPHWYQTIGDEPFAFLCAVPNLPDEIRHAP